MPDASDFSSVRHYDIDWNLTPEHAVTMYLEWGNNDWRGSYPPVRSKADVSQYFVVDTWDAEPVVRLVRRNSEQAEELLTLALPPALQDEWKKEFGRLRGIFALTPSIKAWLRQEMEGHPPAA